jgi:hypothetical protein
MKMFISVHSYNRLNAILKSYSCYVVDFHLTTWVKAIRPKFLEITNVV